MWAYFAVLAVLAGLATPSTCGKVDEACIAKRTWEVAWPNTNSSEQTDAPPHSLRDAVDIAFWLPPLPPEGAEVPALSLEGESFQILLTRGGVVSRTRGVVQIERSFTPPLPFGWVEVRVEGVDGGLEVRRGEFLLGTFPLQEAVEFFSVDGSNVTINCRQDTKVWQVRDEEQVAIPLPSGSDHVITLFPSNFSRPKLMLSPSGSPGVTLGWEGTRIVEVEGEDDSVEGLPPEEEYRLRLGCSGEEPNVTCVLSDEVDSSEISVFLETTFPTAIVVSGSSADDFYVLYERQEDEEPLRGRRRVTVGYVTSIVIIGLSFIGIIFTVVFSSVRHKPRGDKKLVSFEEGLLQEYEPFLGRPEDAALLTESGQNVIEEELKLWEAVKSGDVEAVETLLEEGSHPDDVEEGRETTPFFDAHFLGFEKVLDVMLRSKGEEAELPAEDLVKDLTTELETRMKEVFVAAECGMYERERGVHQLLDVHQLPATITDHLGRSLVHYMTSTTAMDGRPPWALKDIKKFLSDHEYYVNAVDHCGRTALHQIALHPQTSEMDIIWEGKEWDVSEAWLELAKILLTHGCDPRIHDHKGDAPHQLAKEAGNDQMARLLEERCEELGPTAEASPDQHEELVTSCRMGDTTRMRRLLSHHVPLLPMYARDDPLREAIRHHQRDALFLLLAAGAPISSRYASGGITPLEASQTQVGLPACFPAIMRKVTSERLEHEMTRIPEEAETLADLREGMGSYSQQVLDVGIKARWALKGRSRRERGQDARRLLTLAADLGLSFTCLLLSLEDVFLNPLPGEASPLAKAASRRHKETELVLCRDVGLSPCLPEGQPEVSLNLQRDIWLNERKVMEEICSSEDNLLTDAEKCSVKAVLSAWTNKSSMKRILHHEEPSEIVFFLAAKYGLVMLIDVLFFSIKKPDIDRVVQVYSSSTVLHVAAASNRLQLVEYSVHRGADTDRPSLGNFCARDMAALRGHKRCLEYLAEIVKKKEIPQENPKSLCLMNKYEKMLRKYDVPALSHEDSLSVKAEREGKSKAHLTLKAMAKTLDIRLPKDLLESASEKVCPETESRELVNKVKDEIEVIFGFVEDPRFEGTLEAVGSAAEGNELFAVSQVEFVYQLSRFTLSPDNPLVTYRDLEANDKLTLSVESQTEQDLFKGAEFHKIFGAAVTSAVRHHSSSSRGIRLAPPFVSVAPEGVDVHWLLEDEEEFKLIRSRVIPALLIDLPDNDFQPTSQLEQHLPADADLRLHLVNVDGEWLYRTHRLENEVFGNLGVHQKSVWLACRLIHSLLESRWWAPPFSSQHPAEAWHTLSSGVEWLPERALKGLFLEELSESSEWGEAHRFRRLLAVFRRAAQRDMLGEWAARPFLGTFSHKEHWCTSVPDAIRGVLQFLEKLELAQALSKRRVTIKFVDD